MLFSESSAWIWFTFLYLYPNSPLYLQNINKIFTNILWWLNKKCKQNSNGGCVEHCSIPFCYIVLYDLLNLISLSKFVFFRANLTKMCDYNLKINVQKIPWFSDLTFNKFTTNDFGSFSFQKLVTYIGFSILSFLFYYQKSLSSS